MEGALPPIGSLFPAGGRHVRWALVIGGHSWVGASAEHIAMAVQRGDVSATEVIVDHLDHARLADRVLDLMEVLRDGGAVAEAEQVDRQGQQGFPLAGGPGALAADSPAPEVWA